MKSILQFIFKNRAVLFLNLLICVVFADRSYAQCPASSAPSYSNSCTSDYFTSITASGTGVVSTISVTGSSCTGTYFNYYATQGVIVPGGGTTVSMNVTRYATYNGYLSVYVDWNNDGIYQATELAGAVFYMPIATKSTTYNFTVPASGVVSGTNLHMRLMLSELASGAPCTANWGETCDFYINVNCPGTHFVTVSPSPASICTGGSGGVLTASGAGSGGAYTWSPASGLSATTGATVTANPGGTTVYTVTGTTGSGCNDTTSVTVTVNPSPGAIIGPDTVCAGSMIALSDTAAGGTWSSNNTVIATVDAVTGIVYGVSAGNTTITYSLGGGCMATTTVTVNASPSAIIGLTNVCSGRTLALSDAVAGGAWSSSNTAVAIVTSLGAVSGMSAGTANISYTLGLCPAWVAVTVTSLPAITGDTSVCAGTTIILSNATPGGAWSSGGTTAATVSATGVVYGVASGSAAIIYTVGACSVSLLVKVGLAIGPVTGPSTVCGGSTITLNNSTPGGLWSSGNTAIATVSATGMVKGLSGGTAIISYSATGCSAIVTVTVVPSDAGTITGKDSICIGPAHQITLSDNVSGGTWSSTNTLRANVDPVTGVVKGIATGVDTIKYKVVNSCGTYTAKFVLYVRTAAQCATGIQAAEAEYAELKVFPNPNGGTFTMNLLSAATDEEAHVVVSNMVGEKVSEFITVTNKAVGIKLGSVPGIYLLSVSTAHGRYMAKIAVDY